MIAPALPRSRRWPAVALGALAALVGFGAAAVALEEPPPTTLENIDMGMLQRNLLKIYVCGKESSIHEEKLEYLKMQTQHWGPPEQPRQPNMTPEQVKDMEDRHKFVFNYLLAEKTNAVQMIHIVDRIMGRELHLAGEGRLERAILEKKVELIEVPRGADGKGTEISAAAAILSEALGCPVKVETVGSDIEINRIWFTMGPTTGEAILKQVCASQPKFSYRIENGTVTLRHRDYVKAVPATLLDEEEKKALEDEKKKQK